MEFNKYKLRKFRNIGLVIIFISQSYLLVQNVANLNAQFFLSSSQNNKTTIKADGIVRHWALIIGSSTERRHVEWPLAMYSTLTTYYEYTDESIFLLTTNTKSQLNDFNRANVRDRSSSKRNILWAISEISEVSDEDDRVFIWWSGHGSKNKISTSDGMISDSKLDSALDTISCGFLYLIFGSCYSGSLVNALIEPNRIIYTASNSSETAIGTELRSDFMWATYAALNPNPILGTIMKSAWKADLNKDRKISLRELYHFANDFILNKRNYGTQHPQQWIGQDIMNDSLHFLGDGTYLK